MSTVRRLLWEADVGAAAHIVTGRVAGITEGVTALESGLAVGEVGTLGELVLRVGLDEAAVGWRARHFLSAHVVLAEVVLRRAGLVTARGRRTARDVLRRALRWGLLVLLERLTVGGQRLAVVLRRKLGALGKRWWWLGLLLLLLLLGTSSAAPISSATVLDLTVLLLSTVRLRWQGGGL